MSEKQKKLRATAIAEILKIWKIKDIMNAFPTAIRPPHLGNTAIQYLKNVAQRLPTLAKARPWFVKEAAKAKTGWVSHISFVNIIKALKAIDEEEKDKKVGEEIVPVKSGNHEDIPAVEKKKGGKKIVPVKPGNHEAISSVEEEKIVPVKPGNQKETVSPRTSPTHTDFLTS